MVRCFVLALGVLGLFALSSSASAQAGAGALQLSLEAPALSLVHGAGPQLFYPPTDPKPGSGLGLVIAGWVGVGLGVLNLATLPICFADFYPHNATGLCAGLSIGIAVVGLAVGIPLLIAGYNKRSTYKEWKRRNGFVARLLDTRVAMTNDAALLVYRGEL